MRFTIDVSVDIANKGIKDECIEVLSRYLSKKGVYFGVGYNPNEIDIDKIGRA